MRVDTVQRRVGITAAIAGEGLEDVPGFARPLSPQGAGHPPDVGALSEHALLSRLDRLAEGQDVMLKLTLPDEDGYHRELLEHPRVLRVAALSGGYTREEADARLTRNPGVIASFSRALTEGLTAQMTDEEFDAALDASIAGIYAASST